MLDLTDFFTAGLHRALDILICIESLNGCNMQTTQTYFFKKSFRVKHFYDECMANAMLWNPSFSTNYNISMAKVHESF